MNSIINIVNGGIVGIISTIITSIALFRIVGAFDKAGTPIVSNTSMAMVYPKIINIGYSLADPTLDLLIIPIAMVVGVIYFLNRQS